MTKKSKKQTATRKGSRPAGAEQVTIQRILDQAPGMRAKCLHTAAHKLLRPAVLLLEVLRAQEHAFLPNHAVRPAH